MKNELISEASKLGKQKKKMRDGRIKCDNFRLVDLPKGLEVSLRTLLRSLPK
jgi:hypothetical protein